MNLSDLPLKTRPRLVDEQEAWLDELIVEGRPLAELEAWIRMAAERRIARRAGKRPPHDNRLRDGLIRWLVDKGISKKDIAKEADLTPQRVGQIVRKIGG